jgi:hypothetical protein
MLRPYLKSQIERARAYYQISLPAIYTIMATPVIVVIFYSIILIIPTTRAFATQSLDEYYPVEIITFIGMFLTGIYGLKLFRGARKVKEPAYIAVFYFLFAVGMLFIAMEEISWGQTFFRINTPLALKEINVQQELNFHNISGLQGRSEFFHVGFGFGGLLGIWLLIQKRYWKIGVPLILGPWFGLIAVIGAIDLIQDYVLFYQKLETLTILLAEVIEMLIGVGGFLYVWLNGRFLAFGKIRGIPVANHIRLDETDIWLQLADGRRLVIPLQWFPQLAQIPPQEMEKFQLIKGSTWIQWPDLNLEISVAQLISGVPGLEFFD